MNRTAVFLGLAGALALAAVVIGLGGISRDRITDSHPWASADGALQMQARLSHPYLASGPAELFATVDLTGAAVPGAKRSPVNLALVIDRSGSMAGEKLANAKRAARSLIEQLKDSDRIALVHFGSDVRVSPGDLATGATKERLFSAVDRIEDEGGTNIGDALAAGLSQVQLGRGDFKINRIILMSDGEPTEGVTGTGDLAQVARQIRRQGVTLSAIGLGESFNEDLMQSLAENGAGAYAYLHDSSQLATIFERDLSQAASTVARDVHLKASLPDGVELTEVLGYASERNGRELDVAMPDFASGQTERVVLRLRVDAPEAGRSIDVLGFKLEYRDILRDAPVQTAVRLSATVTDRASEIAAHQDKAATVFAARAQSAANTARAAALMSAGQPTEARTVLRMNDALLSAAATVAGPAAVAPDVSAQGAMVQSFEAAAAPSAPPAEMEKAVKAAKRKARVDYGRMGSTY